MTTRFAVKALVGFAFGAAIAIGTWILRPNGNEHRLEERELREYCRLVANGGELQGGAGGALGWRCIDSSDPSFDLVLGLYDVNNYCRNRFGSKSIATITDLRRPDGWLCTSHSRAFSEKTIEITVDSNSPAVSPRRRIQGVIPVVDSPNRYLDGEGRMNLRERSTIRAFCLQPMSDEGAPPFMYGVITPTLQRGFVRSDFTETPRRALALPRCL